jgi:hypothetical protein
MNFEAVMIDNFYIFLCPHCSGTIQVAKTDINCKIFRHAVYKNSLTPVPPHSTKQQCDEFKQSGEIYGCCMPFTFDGKIAKKCGYL